MRSLREAAGLSQKELASRAGLHPTYLSGVEGGSRNLSLLNVYALAGALEVPVARLLPEPESK